jgi:hypothetical protein
MQNIITEDGTLRFATNANCHELPVEIWRQIFEESVMHIPRALLPLSTSFDVPEKSKYHYTNIAISHVCRYFRHIALSTPILWSTLNFDGSATELKTFLKRSAQLPLTFTSSESYFNPTYPRHFDLFVAIAPRIVNIDIPVERENLRIIEICKNLRHIMLRGSSGYRQSNVETVLKEFESLETIWWTDAHNEIIRLSSRKRYLLHSLHLSFEVSDKYLLSILQCCPALENVSAHVIGTETIQDNQDFRLSRLRDLRVRFSGEDSWLCKLDIPVILDHYEFSYHLPHPKFGVHQWDMQMKSLVLGAYFNLPLLVSWLAREPGVLRTLTLSLQFRTDQKRILQALKADCTRMLCPQLEQVHIRYSLPFEQLPWLPTRRDYKELFYDIYSSRLEFGLPPLRFTWNGVVIVPRSTTEPSTEIDDIEKNFPDLLHEPLPSTVTWLIDR